jgi:hypothetical protein
MFGQLSIDAALSLGWTEIEERVSQKYGLPYLIGFPPHEDQKPYQFRCKCVLPLLPDS